MWRITQHKYYDVMHSAGVNLVCKINKLQLPVRCFDHIMRIAPRLRCKVFTDDRALTALLEQEDGCVVCERSQPYP